MHPRKVKDGKAHRDDVEGKEPHALRASLAPPVGLLADAAFPVVAVRTVESDAPLPQTTPVDERHGAGAMARFDEGVVSRCWLEAYTAVGHAFLHFFMARK